MSFLTKLLGGGDIVKSVGDTLDNLFTSDEERLEAEQEVMKARRNFDYLENKLVAEQNVAQMEVNKQEAKGNWFQSGWRPAIGWIGAVTLAYQFIIYPLLLWTLDDASKAPPQMDSSMMFTIITGMLGIAGMRSFDKFKKTDTKTL
ncbi:MAG: holin family protein [Gammaproteobacteria bacterium]|nr:holin family protein [Gammaproteobacteria bacterium]MCF6363208.1 holin family protein [Gammaproteobacteria bacterium]